MSALAPRADMCSALAHVCFGSKADICGAISHVCVTPNSVRESRYPQTLMSALPPKADMSSAQAHVCSGPIADIAKHSSAWWEIGNTAGGLAFCCARVFVEVNVARLHRLLFHDGKPIRHAADHEDKAKANRDREAKIGHYGLALFKPTDAQAN